MTRDSAAPARSGRPPRDTTARIVFGRCAAATSAAPPPVDAPNRPIGRALVSSFSDSQSAASTSRSASRSMSKRSRPVCSSSDSSAGVRRSTSSVARPPSFRARATARLRGLWRLLPLPCANITMPADRGATVRFPSRRTPAAGTRTRTPSFVRFMRIPVPGRARRRPRSRAGPWRENARESSPRPSTGSRAPTRRPPKSLRPARSTDAPRHA